MKFHSLSHSLFCWYKTKQTWELRVVGRFVCIISCIANTFFLHYIKILRKTTTLQKRLRGPSGISWDDGLQVDSCTSLPPKAAVPLIMHNFKLDRIQMGSLCKIHSSVQVPLKSRLAMELEDCFSWRLPLVKTQNKMNDKTHLVINFNLTLQFSTDHSRMISQQTF